MATATDKVVVDQEKQEENTDEPDEGEGTVSGGSGGGLTSPEFLMLFVGLFFDILGLILNIFCDANVFSEPFAMIFIGLWALSRTGDIKKSFKKKNGVASEAVEDILKQIFKQFGLTLGIKLIPEVGVLISFFLNSWTRRVYKILKDS